MLLSYLFLGYKEFEFHKECSYNGAYTDLQYNEFEFHQEWNKVWLL